VFAQVAPCLRRDKPCDPEETANPSAECSVAFASAGLYIEKRGEAGALFVQEVTAQPI